MISATCVKTIRKLTVKRIVVMTVIKMTKNMLPKSCHYIQRLMMRLMAILKTKRTMKMLQKKKNDLRCIIAETWAYVEDLRMILTTPPVLFVNRLDLPWISLFKNSKPREKLKRLKNVQPLLWMLIPTMRKASLFIT